MTDETNQAHDGASSKGDGESRIAIPNPARRRLIRGGASVAPVILTLTSRPVLGFENACLSPSRMISGNHSGLAQSNPCGGETRKFWYDQVKDVAPGQRPAWARRLFATELAIPATAYMSSQNPQETRVGDVLIDSYEGRDNNPNAKTVPGFASYIIAAYLNAESNKGLVGTVVTPRQVIHMWNDIVGTGKYCPQGGTTMCWFPSGVVGYLTNSGVVPS